jgi:hypothetical protein
MFSLTTAVCEITAAAGTTHVAIKIASAMLAAIREPDQTPKAKRGDGLPLRTRSQS